MNGSIYRNVQNTTRAVLAIKHPNQKLQRYRQTYSFLFDKQQRIGQIFEWIVPFSWFTESLIARNIPSTWCLFYMADKKCCRCSASHGELEETCNVIWWLNSKLRHKLHLLCISIVMVKRVLFHVHFHSISATMNTSMQKIWIITCLVGASSTWKS